MIPVLYISYDGMTDPLGQSQVLPYLIGLTKKAYYFHLISFEKKEKFAASKHKIQELCDANNISWHPFIYTKKPPLLSTLYDIYRMKKKAFALQEKHHFEIVHCRSYISSIVGLQLKKQFKTKFLFDMRGFWADERVDGKIWSKENPVFGRAYRFFKRKEIEFLNESDGIISLTENGKNEILTWQKVKNVKDKIQVIPCCVDLELFNQNTIKKVEQDALKKQLQINQEDKILGYVGSIGTWYMLPEMLKCFQYIHQQNNNWKFLFVTQENKDIIYQEASKLGINNNQILITSCLHNQVPLHLSIFDASLFFIQASYSKKASSPTKQAEIMAMGKALICNEGVGDTDMIVKKFQSGILVDPYQKFEFNIDSLDNVIDKKLVQEGVDTYFSLNSGVEKYHETYKKMIH